MEVEEFVSVLEKGIYSEKSENTMNSERVLFFLILE